MEDRLTLYLFDNKCCSYFYFVWQYLLFDEVVKDDKMTFPRRRTPCDACGKKEMHIYNGLFQYVEVCANCQNLLYGKTKWKN